MRKAGFVVLGDSAILLAQRGVLDRSDAKQTSYVDGFLKEAIDKDGDEGRVGSVSREETANHPMTKQVTRREQHGMK